MIRDAELPASPEAERAILGAILLNDSLLPQAAQLKPEDFSVNANRRIYGRMCDLQKSGRPVEMILLAEELDRHRETEAIGGRAYLSSLIDGVPERPSIKHYVRILKDKALLRETAKWAESISNS
jgi:replicative DNA helicase